MVSDNKWTGEHVVDGHGRHRYLQTHTAIAYNWSKTSQHTPRTSQHTLSTSQHTLRTSQHTHSSQSQNLTQLNTVSHYVLLSFMGKFM